MGLLDAVGETFGIEFVNGEDAGPATVDAAADQALSDEDEIAVIEEFNTEGFKELGIFPLVLQLQKGTEGEYELFLLTYQRDLSTKERGKSTDLFAVIDEDGKLDLERKVQIVSTEKATVVHFLEKDDVDVIPPVSLVPKGSTSEWKGTGERGTVTLHIFEDHDELSEFLTKEKGRLASNEQKIRERVQGIKEKQRQSKERAAIAKAEKVIASA